MRTSNDKRLAGQGPFRKVGEGNVVPAIVEIVSGSGKGKGAVMTGPYSLAQGGGARLGVRLRKRSRGKQGGMYKKSLLDPGGGGGLKQSQRGTR